MSLRQISKELEISPAYLSYIVNGKRPWQKDLYQRYMGVVNTFVNSEAKSVNKDAAPQPRSAGDTGVNLLVGVGRIERPTYCSQSGNELDPATEPNCPECQTGLTLTVPAADLARLAPQVEMALGGKTQELSRR